VSVTIKALWYIEGHLSADLSLDEIATVACVSRFHLSRAFAESTGYGLSSYIRTRRLSLAAQRIALGAPDILSVALDVGYGSHEAFTRAFRQLFGVTPEQLRAQGSLDNVNILEPIRMDEKNIGPLAPPRIVEGPLLLIFGISRRYQNTNAGIVSQWGEFAPHLGNISGQVGWTTYGVICNTDDTGAFDYICGVEVKEFPTDPSDFARLRIPPHKYAVFEHREHISAIATTFKRIWERGLADAGVKADDAPAFERYDEQFNARTGMGGLEIWVPIKS
jgi:AraC family transcriptional regulator